jgi:acetolactate synthase I/II/III large subunit
VTEVEETTLRVAGYIAQLLADGGVNRVFMVTGGGAMHLNDAFGREPRLATVFNHHEQACAIAAESFARLSGRPAVVSVTSGPGGINALNGVYGAYVDSIPMVVVSGQVKRETLVTSYSMPLRQLGDQEVNIVSMASPICKMATLLDDPDETRFTLDRALWLAVSGRPGPVWIDVPIDVQSALIEPDDQRRFDPLRDGSEASPPSETGLLVGQALADQLRSALKHLASAKRPVILVGTGVRLSGAHETFLRVIDKLGIPVVTGFNAHDVLWNNHPLYAGRPGTVGDRGGNFAVQNADYLLVIGCRLNVRQISYNFAAFARAAFTVMIDVDEAELSKPTLSIDLPIHAELSAALELMELLPYRHKEAHGEYLTWCQERSRLYPVVLAEYWEKDEPVNPYCFAHALFKALDEDDIVVTADGTACVVTFQTAHIKPGQRMFSNSGCASMGYDLPAAIGAQYAAPSKRVVCVAGDGSIMLNLQELQTITGNGLPIKLILLNNNGYSSIRQTQQNYFPDNVVGCGPESGLTFPDYCEIGAAFGFEVRRCGSHRELDASINDVLTRDGPQLLEVMLDPEQPFSPKLSSRQLDDGRMVSSPLEDLAPFLSRSELAENMLIPLIED